MRFALLTLLSALLLSSTAAAEVNRPGVSEIRQDGRTVTWVLGIPADELTSMAGGETKEQLAGFLANNVRFAQDGVSCPGGMTHATPVPHSGGAFARVHMRFECPQEYGQFGATSELLLANTVDYAVGDASGTFRFDADHTILNFKSPEFTRWLRDGFEALVTGWEHVLFLAILLLGARSRREFTTFAAGAVGATVLALLLAVYGVIDVPERTLEAITVASIVAVAALPVLGVTGNRQAAIVFALALVHGLALAVEVPSTRALPGFTVGLVLGAALIVSLAGALLLASRSVRRPSRARGQMPA